MPRFAMLLVISALMSVHAAFAQSQPQLSRQQIIDAADHNKDGRIDRIEFLRRMREAFFFVDSTKDGFLTSDEYQRIQGADPRRFAAADRNKDGKISMDEFLKIISEDFDAADKTDDGVLDATEIAAWIGR